MTIKASWNAYSVRNVCINNDFCTSMTCEEYDNLLNYVSSHEPTAKTVETVARMIAQGTETPEDATVEEFLDFIVYELLNKAMTYSL